MRQRTEEWQRWRERGIGASLAAGVMGAKADASLFTTA